ncbi:MAG: DNA polymerase [bacterium]|nr:DNA polymerase [bacterium]
MTNPFQNANLYVGKRVGGEGSHDAKIAWIGEAPGVIEVKEGRPFSPNAPAGKLMTELMHSVGLTRSDIYLTNVIKERPGKSKFDPYQDDLTPWFRVNSQGGVTITPAFIKYRDKLIEELKGLRANVFVPAGNVSLYALTGLTAITKRRGSILEGNFWPGMKVIPTIHPAAALPNKNPIFKYFIKADLKRILEESKTPTISLPSRNLIVLPSYAEICGYLESCKVEKRLAVDIEVLNEEISHVAIAKSPSDAISISFTSQSEAFLTPPQEAHVWRLIAELMENTEIVKENQNITFDAAFMFRKLGIVVKNMEDTMVQMGILFPDFPKSLGFITSLYTREPYYKDERKKQTKLFDERKFGVYNAKDAAIVSEIRPKLDAELVRQGNWETYQWQRRMIGPCVYMQERGMKIDVEGLKKANEEADKRLIELEAKIVKAVGHSFNPRSPDQVATYFYKELGIEPYTKKGRPTTDQNAIRRLARRGIPVAVMMRDYRKAHKFKTSYLDMVIGSDGRLHSSMNPIGSRYGRLSASKDILGEGGNVQTLPRMFYPFVIVDEGCLLYHLDLNQGENRIVANIAPEPLMKEAFDTGRDVHRQTASLILNIPFNRVSNEPGSSPMGNGEHSQRFWGKKSNHAFNYGEGYVKFSLDCDLPEAEGRFIHARYHQMYPGVRQYWNWIVEACRKNNRVLTNLFGRKQLFLGQWGDDLFKDLYAYIPQSTIADKVNRQAIIPIYEDQGNFKILDLLNQIHDAILFQIPLSYSWIEHAEALLKLVNLMTTPLEWHGSKFVVPVDVKIGTNLGNMIGVKYGDSAGELATQLKSIYEECILTHPKVPLKYILQSSESDNGELLGMEE